MAQNKKNYQGVPKQENCESFTHCKPPPPPGGEDLWELQFCRWWGWNWVRKREGQDKIQENSVANNNIQENPVANKGPNKTNKGGSQPKKCFKELCNCLRFKKGETQVSTLKNLYNTPSNSVMVQEKYSYEVVEVKNDAFGEPEDQRKGSPKKGKEIADEKRNNVMFWINERSSYDGSSEECYSSGQEIRSTTEESIEYINVSCPCCHCKEPSCEKLNCETQTLTKTTNVNVTQTSLPVRAANKTKATETIKKDKKRRICVICCHCHRNHCKCRYQKTGQEKTDKSYPGDISQDTRPSAPPKSTKANVNKHKESTSTKRKYAPLDINGLTEPFDMMLYYNFIKFGLPLHRHIKPHGAASDILDRIHTLKFEDKFFSPITGKSYDLTPVKINKFDAMPKTLPEPIGISADLQHLKKLEGAVDTDLESKVMLEAICDAILSNTKSDTTSSSILKGFTYPVKEPEDHYDISELKKCKFHDTDYLNLFKDDKSNHYDNLTTVNSFLNFDFQNQDSFLNDSTNEENKFDGDDTIKSLMLNYKFDDNQISLGSNTIDENGTRIPNMLSDMPADAYNLLSPLFKESEIEGAMEFKVTPSTSVNNIFNKINEIVLKSKSNNEELKNVLNTIRKPTSNLPAKNISNYNKKTDVKCAAKEDTNILNRNTHMLCTASGFKQNHNDKIIDENCEHKENKENIISHTENAEDKCGAKIVSTKKRKKNPIASLPPARKNKLKNNKNK